MKFKIPTGLGACADLLFQTRERRYELKRQIEELEAQEAAIKDHLIKTLPKSEASGVAGKVARASVVVKAVPQVKDWDLFWRGFDKRRDTDLLQRRLADGAVRERWEAGKPVPGVEAFNVVSISLNKL